MSKTYISTSLRRLVIERAGNCCEYCLQPAILSFAPHEIDHVIAEKHGGQTTETNLALACKLCNTMKGSDIASVDPETQEIVRLYQPRRDAWDQQFKIQDEMIVPLTAIGRTTSRLLRFSENARVQP